MDDAKETIQRLRGSMQPRLTSLQGRLQTVSDRLGQLPEQLHDPAPFDVAAAGLRALCCIRCSYVPLLV